MPSQSARQSFVRTMSVLPLATLTLLVACFGAFFAGQELGWASMGSPSYSWTAPATAEGSPAVLVDENDCWVGEAPEGVEPGHVVVTVDGAARYAGERMVGKALGQVFGGEDHGLTIHGFCR